MNRRGLLKSLAACAASLGLCKAAQPETTIELGTPSSFDPKVTDCCSPRVPDRIEVTVTYGGCSSSCTAECEIYYLERP